MDPITWAVVGAKLRKVFSSKWLWIALASLALIGGSIYAFNHYVDNKVETAVTDDRKDSTIQTYQAQDKVQTTVAPIDRKYDVIRQQTQQEYTNVRSTIQSAPQDQREAPAPDLIIDTLNALGGMQRGSGTDGVSSPSDPVG